MAQVINTNSLSLITQNNINKNQSALSTSIERLSSGLRINSAKDDAAGQAIANRFTSNINGLTQAARNANDGISAAQTTEGALSEINNNLQRVRELTVQSQNGTNSDSDLSSIQDEIKSRLDEIDRVSGQTQFNGVNVLAKDGKMSIQVGANDGQTIDINLQKIDSTTLGLSGFAVDKSSLSLSDSITQVGASGALKDVDLSAVATGLKVDASSLTLHNVQDANGAATKTYVVSSGNDNYAVSIDDTTGKVNLNSTDVKYTDTANGVTTAATLTGKYTKVGSDGNGGLVGYVTVQGKDYSVDTAAAGAEGTKALKNSGGAAGSVNQSVDISDISPTTGTNASLYTGSATSDPLALLDKAISQVDKFRSSLGAVQNRLDSAVTNLNNTTTNLSEAQSRIQDADYATEVSNLSKAQIIQQAGNSVLAKANSVPQQVLSLLQG
ncbi:FliC/FljB family flagellin [Erwinia sp. QL-Z3]|uniref:FliC/FljB family flagellin n=1 Tax=Erwinia sp. QL-Z3 TaxID=2547962 RepID=UPI00107126D5|nr:FliC/FljB family flagellin [Erwinia sp. QL-Z3]QBR52173.1 FliC/FljB family flagellin [Erwinia sp. QL-Z3]